MKPEAPTSRAKVHRWSDYGRLGQLSSVQHELLADRSLELSSGSGSAVNAGDLIYR